MNLFFHQLGYEFKKLFARKRTHIGFAGFLIVEIALLFLLNLPQPKAHFRRMLEANGYGFDDYFSGITIAFFILSWTTVLLGALYLSLVSGDIIAKEVEEGTLRMILSRPVSRFRIGLVKYIACVGYTFVRTGFIGVTALITGYLYRGGGGLFVYVPARNIFALYGASPGLLRYAVALPALALSQTVITSLGFMFSCFNGKPATATASTLSLILFDFIFGLIPYFESLRPYFITTHMATWMHLFEPHIPGWRMAEDYAVLLALNATFFIVGLAVFERRDFKNG
ncbi:MAG: ABC transporter permease [Chthoniobacteraceae bacterium]